MKIDDKGNMYVAQWFGGKILKIAPTARSCTCSLSPRARDHLWRSGGKDLYVTVVKDPNDAQAKGSIVRIPNE
jgi:sugar lactone lactonase YvrE